MHYLCILQINWINLCWNTEGGGGCEGGPDIFFCGIEMWAFNQWQIIPNVRQEKNQRQTILMASFEHNRANLMQAKKKKAQI